MTMRAWILERLAERSTIVGIITALANLLGLAVVPSYTEHVATLSAFVAAGALVAVRERG